MSLKRIAILALALLWGAVGCVNPTAPYNAPSVERVKIEASLPGEYRVRVGDKASYVVPSDGNLTVPIPRLERGRKTYVLGVKVRDKSAYDFPAVFIDRDGKQVRALTLNQLRDLPKTSDGASIIAIP